MDKVYENKKVEEKIYKQWEEKGFFKPEINPEGKPYCVILPPPNANGNLHFGHAMMSLEDILIRYHRMKGESALFLPGADHAGFETQYVFEKKLQAEGKSRFDFDRDTLYQMIWDYVMENKSNMENQLKKLGFSLDWSREKFTLDPQIVTLVYKTFKKLSDDGLLYRGDRLVNYCTKDGTSFSDLETVTEEKQGTLYYIKYPLVEGGSITVATTRPETMFGDVAVMINPKDKRYKDYVGKSAKLPLTNRIIPIISDPYVDSSFGTGAVKVTPSHDINDFEVGRRHDLPMIQVIAFDGKMQQTGVVDGLYPKQARSETVRLLKEQGFLEKEAPHLLVLKTCYKCKTVLEPLPLEQWYIQIKPLAEKAIKVVKEGKIKFYPKDFEKRYFQWVENLNDWNISRQVVWGIRIPAWQCQDCKKWIITEGEKPEKCPYCGSKNLNQDEDTFDTWFSSGQWPIVALKTNYDLPKMGFHEEVVPEVLKGKTKTYRLRDYGLKVGDKVLFENTQKQSLFGYGIITQVKKTTVEEIDFKDKTHYKVYKSLDELIAAFKLRNPDKAVSLKSTAYLYAYDFYPLGKLSSDFEKFYPTSVMETGYDILPAWVSRMIMLGLYMTNEVPFRDVVLHGLVKDPYGKKMSKSKGNVVNPLELVDQYGADSVRFALVYGTALGNDQSLSYPKLQAMRNFSNKLWNMARFIEMKRSQLGNAKSKVNSFEIKDLKKEAVHLNDKAMVEKTEKLVDEITKLLDKYDFNHAAQNLYDFTWHEFADKYIEDVKNRIDENSYLLLSSLFLILLKLLHPFMPFVTEEINHQLYDKDQYLIISKWPK